MPVSPIWASGTLATGESARAACVRRCGSRPSMLDLLLAQLSPALRRHERPGSGIDGQPEPGLAHQRGQDHPGAHAAAPGRRRGARPPARDRDCAGPCPHRHAAGRRAAPVGHAGLRRQRTPAQAPARGRQPAGMADDAGVGPLHRSSLLQQPAGASQRARRERRRPLSGQRGGGSRLCGLRGGRDADPRLDRQAGAAAAQPDRARRAGRRSTRPRKPPGGSTWPPIRGCGARWAWTHSRAAGCRKTSCSARCERCWRQTSAMRSTACRARGGGAISSCSMPRCARWLRSSRLRRWTARRLPPQRLRDKASRWLASAVRGGEPVDPGARARHDGAREATGRRGARSHRSADRVARAVRDAPRRRSSRAWPGSST